MGCGGSKVDDLPLVIRCRERKELVKAASDHRYALAAAHVLYFHSLKDVGNAIRRFVDEELVISDSVTSSSSVLDSPVLTLPSKEGKKPKLKHHFGNLNSNSSSADSSSHNHNHHTHNHKHHKKEIEEEDSHLDLSSSSSISSDLDSHDHDIHDHHDRVLDDVDHMKHDHGVPSTSYNNLNGNDHNYNYNSNYNYPPQGNWGYGYNYNGESNQFPYPPPSSSYPNSNPFPFPFSSGPNTNMYFMKKSATPAKTVVYEDPTVNGYSSFYGNGSSNGGYFGYPMMMPSPRNQPSPQRPPPLPPSPPRVSTWDFLNVFDSFDHDSGYQSAYYSAGRYGYGSNASSPDSNEVREREGIPALEDAAEQEVIKEVNKEKKRMKDEINMKGKFSEDEVEELNKNSYGEGTSKSVPFQGNSEGVESLKGKEIRTSASPDTFRSPDSIISTKSQDVEFVRKKGVSFEVEEAPTAMDVGSSKPSSLATLSAHGTRDLEEAVLEIRDEFETASSYGKEVASMLEVGKLPYQRRTTLLKAILSRILYLVSSQPPTSRSVHISSKTMKMAKEYSAEPGNDFNLSHRNLSSTLDTLYAWEKKLYKEVKDEERLRVIYEKECRRLKSLDENGAESSKIEATQASIRKLLTKINVTIKAVDAISSKIHKLRDEELQPQVAELIHGLIRMWKSMVRCHQKQFQAIIESKVRSLRANTGLRRDSGLRATLELETELINWCNRFNNWVNTQKSYIESLNEWLYRCLLVEPEETVDGVAPFSPSRMGAPPIFVLCNDWYQAMVRISEKGVENAMLEFASNLHQLWERQDEEQRQRTKAEYVTKDFEKRLRALKMERAKIEQEHDASSEKAISKANSESGVSPLDDLKVDLDSMRKRLEEERARHKEAKKLVHDAASGSLQAGLVPIFEALGNFSSEVLKAHEQVRFETASG